MENFRIGNTQTLTVLRTADFGIYLGFEGQEEAILLPKKQVPSGTKIGDRLEVFVYRDSEDRPIATVNRPYAEVSEFAWLKVKGVSKYGAFLDWGLEKDLFLPFKEQEYAVRSGDRILVRLYLDKSERIAASMKIYDFLRSSEAGEYQKEDAFTGYVYRTQKEIGAFVAVVPKNEATENAGNASDTTDAENVMKARKTEDGRDATSPASTENPSYKKMYFGLIPKSQVFKNYRAGEQVQGRIVRVREDLKLDLSVRARDFEQLTEDGEKILKKIEEYDGVLPFSDNASPEIIKRELEMSKNGFKKALGHLLKAGKVKIGGTEVTLVR